ncbi:MAG: extracellular solute-binding protein [Dehalococcoidia bacterium]|nr:extracellular solute-binding protein [Dehalococcoidia bacterium]
MKRFNYAVLLVGMAVLMVISACAPGSTPTPAPAAPTPANTNIPTSNVSPSTSQDPAWDKIVEAAKKEGKLTIYSFNFVGDTGISIAKAFKEKYGITVEIITGRGAEFTERLKTEKRMGSILADVCDNNATNAKTMKKEGLTKSVAGELPVLREKGVWVADVLGIDPQDKHLISFNFTIYSPWVNTRLVKSGEEPKVWKDLLDPKWKSKMIATDTTTSPGLYQSFVPLIREKVVDTEFLKALYNQDLRFSSTIQDEAGLLARGDRAISIRGNDSVYSRFINEGAPIKVIDLSDGVVLSVISIVAFEGSPHPNAAKVFLNWLMSPEGQTTYGKSASAASARKDVPNFLPEAARLTPKNPILLTSEDTDESTKLFRERWLDKLWGR